MEWREWASERASSSSSTKNIKINKISDLLINKMQNHDLFTSKFYIMQIVFFCTFREKAEKKTYSLVGDMSVFFFCGRFCFSPLSIYDVLIFYLPHMEYEGSIGFVMRKMKKNYCWIHVLGLYMAKKQDLSDKFFSVCHAPLPLPYAKFALHLQTRPLMLESWNFGCRSLLGQLDAPRTQNFEIQVP
jgi:hypothetical protein